MLRRIHIPFLFLIWPAAAHASTKTGGEIILFGGIAVIVGAISGAIMALARSRLMPWLLVSTVVDIALCFLFIGRTYDWLGARETLLANIVCGVLFAPLSLVITRKIMSSLMHQKHEHE